MRGCEEKTNSTSIKDAKRSLVDVNESLKLSTEMQLYLFQQRGRFASTEDELAERYIKER